MKDKNGFTLVELLAVIIILGILSVLIVPKITNTLNESEKKTNMASAQNLIKTAEYKIANNEVKGISENITIDYTNNINTELLDFSGKKPEKGKIQITTSGRISMAIKIEDNCYIKTFESSEITMQAYDSETCKASKSFAEDSWLDIKSNLMLDRNFYNIGDTKEAIIDGISYTVRLANTESCPNDWPQSASQTTCGVVIEFVDVIQNENRLEFEMNSTRTNEGGWPASSMYTLVNTTIFNKLPNELKEIIIDTQTVSGSGDEGTNFTSTDKLYLLSYVEIFGNNSTYDTVKLVSNSILDGTRELEYYRLSGDDSSARIKTKIDGTHQQWWLRSAYAPSQSAFGAISWGSYFGLTAESAANGVAPAFRILD